jgi:polysaccharide biosynthesis transport protein
MNASPDAQVVRAVSGSTPLTVPGRRPNPVASLLLHWQFALLIGLAVLILGMITLLSHGQPQYVAESQLEISPTFPSALPGTSAPFSSDEEYRGYVDQQVAEIRSYATMSAALKLLGNDRWLWQRHGESERTAAERLSYIVDVKPIPDTYLISVSLSGNQPEGLAKIVNAVVNAYLQRHQHRELDQSDQRVQLLVQHKAQLEKETDNLRTRENQLAQELGVSTFGSGFANPFDKMLIDATEALGMAHRATVAAQAHLDALNAEEQRAKALEVGSTAERMAANDPEVTDALAQLTKQREAVFLELQQLGPEHPGRPVLQAEMQNINDEIARLNNGMVGRLSVILRQSHATAAQREISQAEAKVDQAHRTQAGIEKLVEDLRVRASSTGATYKNAVSIDAQLTRDNTEIQQIDEQIGLLRIQTQSPGFVSLESAAMMPDIPVSSKQTKIAAIFLVGALVLAVGVPSGLDLIDPLVKTADELEAIVGFPPFGAVLGSEGRAAHEALRRIALGVIRECRASETRNFVLTPVSEGTASRTLALALARELNSLGIRAAAVESNDFIQKSMYGDSMSNGESDHSVEFDAIGSARAPYLASSRGRPELISPENHPRLASPGSQANLTERENVDKEGERNGKLASNGFKLAGKSRPGKSGYETPAAGVLSPTSLETQARLTSRVTLRERGRQYSTLTPQPVRRLLDKVRNRYEVLLFDAPPILTSADAEMLIQMPAGAILVVRAGHDVPRDVRTAMRRLGRIEPPVVGTVITDVSPGNANHDCRPQTIIKRWLAAR